MTSLLEDHPDPVSKVLASFLRIEPQDRDIPAVSSPVSLEDLHQRGLSCSVRPEEPEYLAATDREIDPVEGHGLPVGLAEAPDPHGLRLMGLVRNGCARFGECLVHSGLLALGPIAHGINGRSGQHGQPEVNVRTGT
jgi:hypothetical protein